jgi:murein DD-endopeptidase MepM/ murein hydrolase activator NlpD
MRPAALCVTGALAFVLASSVLADDLAAPAPRSSEVAALQVALRARGVYAGAVDGVAGPATSRAVRAVQRRAGLAVDGIAGPATRAALGRRGRPQLGRRVPAPGDVGWDVAQLQFLLAWRGFPSGTFDGAFGSRTAAALRRFQRSRGLAASGRLHAGTLAALRAPAPRSPIGLAWPLRRPAADGFGPRGARFHAGIDIPAPTGEPVAAAGAGRVAYAGRRAGGWGLLVSVAHGRGIRTLYAHLSRVTVAVGDRVAAGSTVGLVGSTGHASAPHLHFEVRVRGAAVDPLTALGSLHQPLE